METTTEELVDPLVGRLLDDRYRLDSLIARGGMATVFLANDTRLDRTVAVKVMHRALADDPEFVARFTREARASARLSSAEVVAVYDQGTDAGTGLAYLVMEHVRGRNLRDLLRERGALPPAQALELLEPVLVALAAAHAAGLVHRDIKPENVLLADAGRIKVADFGLARAVEASNLTATTGLLIGTVAYLAPEQVETGRADARSDVYAAGILLWEALTGEQPYTGETPLSVALQHVRSEVPAPSTVVAALPRAVDALVLRATRRDPADRPADGSALLADLRAVRSTLPTDRTDVRRSGGQQSALHRTLVVPRPFAASVTAHPTRPPTEAGADRPRRRRRGRIALAVVALLALLAGGGGYYLGQVRFTTTPGVLGLDKAAARQVLTRGGLGIRLGTAVSSETIPAGAVLGQSPRPGARISRHGAVTLVFSLGPDRRRVPDVVGSTEPASRSALTAAGLAYRSTALVFSRTVAKGVVLSTDPPVGSRLKPGTPVALIVSKGVQQVAVPDVRGKDIAAATATLVKAGFVVTTSQAFSDTAAKASVLDQSPNRGSVDLGSTVALVVSKGPDLVKLPDLTGDDRDRAVSALQALGLKTNVLAFPGGPGLVLRTSPGGGTMVRRGSTVTLYAF